MIFQENRRSPTKGPCGAFLSILILYRLLAGKHPSPPPIIRPITNSASAFVKTQQSRVVLLLDSCIRDWNIYYGMDSECDALSLRIRDREIAERLKAIPRSRVGG